MDVVYISFQERSPDIYNKVILAKEGNQKAMAFLLERYRKSLLAMILKMVRNLDDAEDLTIEVFEKAFRNLHRFDAKYSFSTWLFKIGTNHTIDFLRQKRLKTFSISNQVSDGKGETFSIDMASGDSDPQEILLRKQSHENLREIVSQLPAMYQTLVRMKYFDELSLEEIQKEIDIPLNTIKIRLFRARNLILGIMDGKKNNRS
ncbi:MAG TPA: sigma-70 family RNA polymerase sigma factor [Catalimonadaceae bacterium]|nr:sigma-70 family RNA polymerase sigma factor [Catalimonadaceae bacterium]HPI10849.1 sigma-70 family RNA polymerase sigma factor [Catalimonadaceae bacterium]